MLLREFQLQYAELVELWDHCAERITTLNTIKTILLSSSSLSLKSAICIGLGSFERAKPKPLGTYTAKDDWLASDILESWEDDVPNASTSKHDILSVLLKNRPVNHSMLELVAFETILTRLHERFPIGAARFQDPQLTATDRKFLESRGHEVLPYPSKLGHKNDKPADPAVLNLIDNDTFLFGLCLDRPLLVQLLCQGRDRPGLVLSENLVQEVGNPCLHRPAYNKSTDLEKFEDIAVTSEFGKADVLGQNDVGFSWQMDTTDDEALRRYEFRLGRAENAKERWKPLRERRQRIEEERR